MNVALTSDQENFIAEQVRTGHYKSASDVIGQSLEILRAQEEFIRMHTAELREKIGIGLEQARRGELVDGKTAIQDLRKKLGIRREE